MAETRPYRVIIHNVSPTEENVKASLESEIKGTELLDFEVEATYNYEAPVTGGAIVNGRTERHILPQRDIIVKLNYRIKESKC